MQNLSKYLEQTAWTFMSKLFALVILGIWQNCCYVRHISEFHFLLIHSIIESKFMCPTKQSIGIWRKVYCKDQARRMDPFSPRCSA